MAAVVPLKDKEKFSQTDCQTGAAKIDIQQILHNSPIAFFTCGINGKITFYNQAAEKLWNAQPSTEKDYFTGPIKIFYPNGKEMPVSEFPASMVANGANAITNQMVKVVSASGKVKTVLVSAQPIINKNKKLTGIQSSMVEVTLPQSEEIRKATLSAIVESSDDAIISKDLNGIINSWNRGATKIFGYTEDEVIGKSITLLIPDERLEEETIIIGKIVKGEKIDHFETIRKAKDGRLLHISLTVSPIKDGMGNIVGASKIARDVTEQVKFREEIKKYTHNLEILNTVGKDISENLDVQAILQRVTDSTTKLTTASFGAFFYNNVDEGGDSFRLFTLSGASRASFEKLGMPRHTKLFLPTFVHKKIIRIPDVLKHEDYAKNSPLKGMPPGHLPVRSYLAVPVISKSGKVIGGLLFGHQKPNVFNVEHENMVVNIAAQAAVAIDNSRLFEEVKSLSDKKDEFIALASHELKTPLTTIKGYLQVLSKKEKGSMTAKFIEKSLNQTNKLHSLIEDLLNMSRIQAGKLELNLETFDLRDLLLEIVEIFEHSHDGHNLQHDLGEEPVLIEADKQRIEQVINNLMNNAVKYSPEAENVFLKLELNEKKVRVSVKDEGIGLTEQQQQQIFTRFFRAENTKGISGLGLGLYLSKEIIDRHNGKIGVISKLNVGSEFYFELPVR